MTNTSRANCSVRRVKRGATAEHDEQTATALLDAAERIVAESGTHALVLRDLAPEAGTSTRAVYSLFGSKIGLLSALGGRAFNLLQERIEALPASDRPSDDLVEAALIFRRFALEHPALFSIAFHDAERPFGRASAPRSRSPSSTTCPTTCLRVTRAA